MPVVPERRPPMSRLIHLTACFVHTSVKGNTGWVVVTEKIIDRMSRSPVVSVTFAPCERCEAAREGTKA